MNTEYLKTAPIGEIKDIVGKYIKQGMDWSDSRRESMGISSGPNFTVVFKKFLNDTTSNDIAIIRKRLCSDDFMQVYGGAVIPNGYETFKRLLIGNFDEDGKLIINEQGVENA